MEEVCQRKTGLIKLSQIVKKFKNPGRAFEYILGRFYLVRKCRRLYNAITSGRSKTLPLQNRACFTEMSSDHAAVMSSLRSEGVFDDLRLTDQTVNELQQLLAQAGTKNASPPWQDITIEDAKHNNRTDSKAPILMISHQSKELSDYAKAIAHDEALFAIANRFLGRVVSFETRIQTSLVVVASTEYRESKNQTVMFHYDVEGYNFLYCFFYLTDCDEYSGAHEMIAGSHKRKPLHFLLSSAVQSDPVIYQRYKGKSRIIKGPAGSGFIEDTSCYHRALAPIRRDRTCLQIRYKG